ncbi:MAG: ABC transporter permease subunit [Lachnospiraceae bacterium]|nr:ABC transporter permease subunit [Lachnospiraceae bacterium]
MNRLLAANIVRLRKNKCFLGGILLLVILGILYPVMKCIEMKNTGYETTLDTGFFIGAAVLPVLLSVFVSLFIGTEYSDGTIRNKIMVGHERKSVYLANLLTNLIAAFALNIVFSSSYLAAGIPLLGFFQEDLKVIFLFAGIEFVLICSFTALFTVIAVLISNKAVSAVICVLGTFLVLFAASYLNARLNEPETYPAYTYVEGRTEVTEEEEKNPLYLDGKERERYQFLYDFLPGGQVIQCVTMTAVNPKRLPVYSAILFVLTTAGGVLLFERKDIK